MAFKPVPRYDRAPTPPAVLNAIPRQHVPGHGVIPSRLMFIGEAPGRQENAAQVPFIGQSGDEHNRYLRAAGLERSKTYTTNLAKYWPLVDARGRQLPPSAADIARDADELAMEIEIVQPEIIGAIGAHAARALIPGFTSLFAQHGIPRRVEINGREITVVPIHHPAGGLHSGSQEDMARIQWDYQQVGRLSRGQLSAESPIDRYPNVIYRRIYDAESGPHILMNALAGKTYLFLDTEGTIADPECSTVAVTPGEGWYIGAEERETLAALHAPINAPGGICTVGCHYLAYDIPVLAAMNVIIDRKRARNSDGSPTLRCTMLEAHLLGGTEPKGLKALMWRLAGIEGEGYEDVTGPTEYAKVRGYLERVWTEASCGACVGTGKADAAYKVIDPECGECGGSGRVPGAKPGKTKQCGCVKSRDACRAEGCVGGLLIPAPERELVFDPKTGAFRYKQPQSAAVWIRKRLSAEPLTETDDQALAAEDDEPPNEYFKLRRVFLASPVAAQVQQRYGRLPRTRLGDVPDQDRVTTYAVKDADAGLRISGPLEDRLSSLGLIAARDIDARMIPALSAMEQTGMRIDREHFERFRDDLGAQMDELGARLADLCGERNPNSKRLAGVLFGQLGLPSIKLTATGQESTDNEVLDALRQQLSARAAEGEPDAVLGTEIVTCIQDYRERQKLRSTYCEPLLLHADRNDRVHTTLNYTRSMTRLSSSEPINLQTIPNPDNSPFKDDPLRNFGLRMRNGFVARPGYKLISCDFSQIELVVGAHLSQDRNLLRAFRDGLDLHYLAASELLGVAYDQVPKATRTQMKPLNFGAFYDISPQGLAIQFASMGIAKTEDDCAELLAWYFRDFAPDVLAWKQRVRMQARIDGFVRTMFGRLRHMPGLRSDIKRVRSAAERECTNAPVQGTAGDILRIALGDIHEQTLPFLWDEGIDIQCIMTIHDELTYEVEEKSVDLVIPFLENAMKYAVKLSVPINVGTKVGDRWGQLT